jgi:hypothetical protein
MLWSFAENLVHDSREQCKTAMKFLQVFFAMADSSFQFYFMDNEADTEPRKFFSFDGCIIKMDKNMLEIEVSSSLKPHCSDKYAQPTCCANADQGAHERICPAGYVQVSG